MDISKLQNNINTQVNTTNKSAPDQIQDAAAVNKTQQTKATEYDKVTLNSARQSEKQFAKTELDKLNKDSFNKLQDYKSKLNAYEAAKEQSPEAAANTEIGQMLNNPDVWAKMAEKIAE